MQPSSTPFWMKTTDEKGRTEHEEVLTAAQRQIGLVRLDNRSRRLLAMKFYGYGAIERQLGITPESARVQVSRLLAKLKSLIQKSTPRKVKKDVRTGLEKIGTVLPAGREKGTSRGRRDLVEPIS